MAHPADAGWIQLFEGVYRHTLAAGDRMLQMEVRLEPGSHVIEHAHPHDQISYVARGRLRFFLAGEPRELAAGESVYIPGGVRHAVDALEESLAIDTFSPPREDYLAADRAALEGQC